MTTYPATLLLVLLLLALPGVAAQGFGRLPEVVAVWELDDASPIAIGENRTITLHVAVDCSTPGALPPLRANVSEVTASVDGLLVTGGEPMQLDASVCPGAAAQAETQLRLERVGGPAGEATMTVYVALEGAPQPPAQQEAIAQGMLALAEEDAPAPTASPSPQSTDAPGPSLVATVFLAAAVAAFARRR